MLNLVLAEYLTFKVGLKCQMPKCPLLTEDNKTPQLVIEKNLH